MTVPSFNLLDVLALLHRGDAAVDSAATGSRSIARVAVRCPSCLMHDFLGNHPFVHRLMFSKLVGFADIIRYVVHDLTASKLQCRYWVIFSYFLTGMTSWKPALARNLFRDQCNVKSVSLSTPMKTNPYRPSICQGYSCTRMDHGMRKTTP